MLHFFRVSFFRYSALSSVFLLVFFFSCQSEESTKHAQYVAEGYTLFQTHCANCHQRDGKGLSNLYPAIAPEYLKDKAKVICWIKNGVNQSVTVNGKTFNRPMPANPALKELEIAEIMTYMYTTWGNDSKIITTETVQKALEQCVSN
ncbi:c-type cytochrome [Runella aurantiaca]|uniref:Cytochrome c n=1 Tax=Runella aurantiaca TaxID=2282308 RepID=A0A369I9G9_9BACT|nr:cytochrome c [Runella aurantiaca]RDB03814.1 cytochrome c [Runella aurantiaca]